MTDQMHLVFDIVGAVGGCLGILLLLAMAAVGGDVAVRGPDSALGREERRRN